MPTNRTEEPMKKTALAFLLLLSTFAWTAGDPNPAEYTVNVHVSSSQVDTNGTYNGTQGLSVVIHSKKYELRSEVAINRLLALGDYKAKLVQDEHKTTYDSVQVYEFLFADKKTRKFDVVGQTE
jgi:hypothetical protein